MGAVQILNSMTTRSPKLIQAVQRVPQPFIMLRVSIESEYLPSANNVFAHLSRLQFLDD